MLVGERIILEEICRESIEQMRKWRNDPSMRKYFREWKDITPDKQEKWYSEMGNNSNAKHIYFQIMAKDGLSNSDEASIKNRRLIGCCGLLNTDWRLRSSELSIYINPAEQGTGKGKETLNLLMDYGFSEMNLNKIWGECYDNNNAIELYKKVGFVVEGIIRDSYFHGGKYGNSYIFSILEKEWRKING